MYYIHGFRSNCNTTKSKLAAEIGATCIHYTDDHLKNGNVFDMLKSVRKEDIVIGSSLGGYLALSTHASIKFLLNPLLDASRLNRYGDFSRFVSLAKEHPLDYNATIYTFIGKRDEVLDHDLEFFNRISKAVFVLDDDHRFSANKEFVFKVIRLIVSQINQK